METHSSTVASYQSQLDYHVTGWRIVAALVDFMPLAILFFVMALFLEPVYNLFRISTAKARTTICRLVLSFLSQFFQSRRHFSSQATDRSTTHLWGSTSKLCSSERLATTTEDPNIAFTAPAKDSPV